MARDSARGRKRLLRRALPALLLVLTACTEDPITGLDPADAPGATARTTEVIIPVDELPRWRDTTFTGFANPAGVGFSLVIDDGPLEARTLARFLEVPNSVSVDGEETDVEAYESAEVRIVLDTARIAVPDGFTMRLVPLSRSFVATEATWDRAAAGDPWQSPGGDFDPELGRLDVEEPTDSLLADTLRIPLEGPVDSLLTEWSAEEGAPGIGVLVEGEGAQLRLRGMVLSTEVRPEGESEEPVESRVDAGAVTFIYDPDPDPPENLRLGGIPASRFYFEFRPPDSAGGISLDDATINLAELVFQPIAPPAHFRFLDSVAVNQVELIADPFELGAKTPIGGRVQIESLSLVPDSLAAGRPLRLPVDTLVRDFVEAPEEEREAVRLGAFLQPDGQTLGYWDFGSRRAEPALRPSLRLLVTPSPFESP